MITISLIAYTIASTIFLYVLYYHGGIFEKENCELKLDITKRLMSIGLVYQFISIFDPVISIAIGILLIIPLVIITIVLVLYLLLCY